MQFRSERFFLSGYFVLAISVAAFSMPLVDRGELVKLSSTQEHSSGVMLGVNPGRTRAYEIPTVVHPASVQWKTSKLFVVDRSYPLTLTYEGIPGMSSETIWRPSGHGFSDPVMADGAIYFSLYINDGHIFAQHSANGGDKWRLRLPAVYPSGLAVANSTVLGGGNDGTLFALSAASGKVLWNKGQKGYKFYTAAPLVANAVVYFCSTEYSRVETIRPKGRIFALELATGNQLWVYETKTKLSVAAYEDKTIFVGDSEGNFLALDAVTGKERWRYKSGGGSVSSPAVKNGVVYFSLHDGSLRAVDAHTGQERWKAKEPKVATQLAADDTHIYFGGENRNLYALDKADGRVKWIHKTNNECRSPVLGGGTVCFTTGDEMRALDAATGAAKWKVVGLAKVLSAPILTPGAIYFLDGDGHLYSLKQ